MKSTERKAKAARYLKVVEWSDADKCFVGRCPGLFQGGIHGDDETEVYRELCEAAEEWVEIIDGDGKPLPASTAGKTYSGKFVVRISPELHQRAALKALARGASLNQLVADALARA
jgi:predicted HicB family RNase H-like nuclease